MFNPSLRFVVANRAPVKAIWDLLALGRVFLLGRASADLPLSFRERMRCLRFYRDCDGIRRLFAISNRSGARWTQLAIELALDLARGGGGEYAYENDVFYPENGMMFQRLDWRVPTGEWESQHTRPSGPIQAREKCFVTHNPFYRLRTSRALDMKTIVITRSIPAIMASLFSKFVQVETRPEVTIDDEDSFDWDASLTKQIAFFNSWGDVMGRHPQIRHYRYEDMKADPVGAHMEIADFWGLPITEDCMAEGLHRASKTEMLKHMPAKDRDGNLRISNRDAGNSKVISDARLGRMIARLDRELIHDFGYTFDMNTPYDTVYA